MEVLVISSDAWSEPCQEVRELVEQAITMVPRNALYVPRHYFSLSRQAILTRLFDGELAKLFILLVGSESGLGELVGAVKTTTLSALRPAQKPPRDFLPSIS